MGISDVYFMKYSLVADHYQHIAIIGVIALAAAGWSLWHKPMREATYWATTAVTVVAVGTLAFLTWQQSGLYRDAISCTRQHCKKIQTVGLHTTTWVTFWTIWAKLKRRSNITGKPCG